MNEDQKPFTAEFAKNTKKKEKTKDGWGLRAFDHKGHEEHEGKNKDRVKLRFKTFNREGREGHKGKNKERTRIDKLPTTA